MNEVFVDLLMKSYEWSSKLYELNWIYKTNKSSRKIVQLNSTPKKTNEAKYGFLPTPVASDIEGGISRPSQILKRNGRWIRKSDRTGTEYGAKLRDVVQFLDVPENVVTTYGKKTNKLSPQFVMEMMGFPPDWTLKPFLNKTI